MADNQQEDFQGWTSEGKLIVDDVEYKGTVFFGPTEHVNDGDHRSGHFTPSDGALEWLTPGATIVVQGLLYNHQVEIPSHVVGEPGGAHDAPETAVHFRTVGPLEYLD